MSASQIGGDMGNLGVAQPAETRHDIPWNGFVRAHAMQYDLDQVGGVGQVYWTVESARSGRAAGGTGPEL